MSESRDCNIRLIRRESMHDDLWRPLRRCKSLGERAANQRRRIVHKHDHRAFGSGTYPTAGSAYRWTLNKAFTIGIDVLLSMLTGQEPLNQTLPPRILRSFV